MPEKTRKAKANDWAIATNCTMTSSLRLSERSAMRPAQAPRNSTGPNWQAARMPTARPLSVRCSTNNVIAIMVSQLPTCEMSWPPKNSRKLRYDIDRNVSCAAPAIRRLMTGRPELLRVAPADRARRRRSRWTTT